PASAGVISEQATLAAAPSSPLATPPHESDMLSAAWETAVSRAPAAPAQTGADALPAFAAASGTQHVPSMWVTPREPAAAAPFMRGEEPSQSRPARPLADEPADFLLEPLPPPVVTRVAAAETGTSPLQEPADPIADIERELFEPESAAIAAAAVVEQS